MDVARGPVGAPSFKIGRSHPFLKSVVREVVLGPRESVVRQGDVPRSAHVLLEGQTCRYRLLANGRRQITAILVPGDVCDLEAAMRSRADYFVETLAPSVLGEIPLARLDPSDDADPETRRALWRHLLRDEAIAREWMVGLGRRSAKERIAHLFCELRERLRMSGLGAGDCYDLHLTQADLADVLGLSTVHVNRSLKELRQDGLAEVRRGALHVADPAALAKLAGFDPAYLEAA